MELASLKTQVNALNGTISDSGEFVIEGQDGTYAVKKTADGSVITTITASAKAFIGNLTAGAISAKEVATENLTIGGQTLEAYVRGVIAQVQQEQGGQSTTVTVVQITPPPAPTQTLTLTEPNSSASGTIAIEQKDGFAALSMKIKDKEVARIDEQGNASFSGTLSAPQASISGTLIAKEIQAENISALTARINELNSQFTTIGTTPLATGTTINSNALTAYDLNVAHSVLIGKIYVQDNSIMAFGDELRISALSQITLFDGSLTIAKNGTLTTQGEIVAKGGVRTDTIRATEPQNNITVQLNNDASASSKLVIADQSNKEVASVTASGSAYFDQGVDFRKYEASDSAMITPAQTWAEYGQNVPSIKTNNEASGNAILPVGATEVLIANTKVKSNSLIYVTATSSTGNQILYVVAKQEGQWFKVKIDQPVGNDVTFNWWIL